MGQIESSTSTLSTQAQNLSELAQGMQVKGASDYKVNSDGNVVKLNTAQKALRAVSDFIKSITAGGRQAIQERNELTMRTLGEAIRNSSREEDFSQDTRNVRMDSLGRIESMAARLVNMNECMTKPEVQAFISKFEQKAITRGGVEAGAEVRKLLEALPVPYEILDRLMHDGLDRISPEKSDLCRERTERDYLRNSLGSINGDSSRVGNVRDVENQFRAILVELDYEGKLEQDFHGMKLEEYVMQFMFLNTTQEGLEHAAFISHTLDLDQRGLSVSDLASIGVTFENLEHKTHVSLTDQNTIQIRLDYSVGFADVELMDRRKTGHQQDLSIVLEFDPLNLVRENAEGKIEFDFSMHSFTSHGLGIFNETW